MSSLLHINKDQLVLVQSIWSIEYANRMNQQSILSLTSALQCYKDACHSNDVYEETFPTTLMRVFLEFLGTLFYWLYLYTICIAGCFQYKIRKFSCHMLYKTWQRNKLHTELCSILTCFCHEWTMSKQYCTNFLSFLFLLILCVVCLMHLILFLFGLLLLCTQCAFKRKSLYQTQI